MAPNPFAEYLVARRAQLRPSDVGLPEGGRRRTPGLRREEVAVRAGVSADYLARLEQGRDTNPSGAVIDALAQALRIEGRDRHHFGWLAVTSSSESRCPTTESVAEQPTPAIETIVRALHPTPAFVLGRRLNVLGWNPAWEDIAKPLGLLDNPEAVNLAWFTFTHPRAKQVLRNWDEVADSFSAALRRATMRWPGEDRLLELITALLAHPEFESRWQPQHIDDLISGTLRFDHPVHGHIDIPFETLNGDRDQSIVVWLTDQTQAQSPGLRLVRAVNE
ncbi:helix-turn-helix transcriptional regulator [Nocardia sp. CA-107356]|uniref:helix-turn-helix transcriptional regulator n=1 Tax=Nocardia sp. CA-107356 TaxID=3239972 RepID=UPI003D9289C3